MVAKKKTEALPSAAVPADELGDIYALRDRARDLAAARLDLARAFGLDPRVLDRSQTLTRIEKPIAAVVGPFSSGKSSMLNLLLFGPDGPLPVGPVPTTQTAVLIEAAEETKITAAMPNGEERPLASVREAADLIHPPHDAQITASYLVWSAPLVRFGTRDLRGCPWSWLDTPGWDSDAEAAPPPLPVRDLADVWVLATPGERPLSAFEVRRLLQWQTEAPDSLTVVALTRVDLVAKEHRPEVVAYARQILDARVPGGAEIPLVETSGAKGDGLLRLEQEVMHAIRKVQVRRLGIELEKWRSDVDAVQRRQRSLEPVPEETIERVHRELATVVRRFTSDLRLRADAVARSGIEATRSELPLTFDKATMAATKHVHALIRDDLASLGRELAETWRAALGTAADDDVVLTSPPLKAFGPMSARPGPARAVAGLAAGGVAGALLGGLVAVPLVGAALLGAGLGYSALKQAGILTAWADHPGRRRVGDVRELLEGPTRQALVELVVSAADEARDTILERICAALDAIRSRTNRCGTQTERKAALATAAELADAIEASLATASRDG